MATSTVCQTIAALKADPRVEHALGAVKQNLPDTIEVQKELTLIEAPTGDEKEKATRYAQLLTEAGLEEVKMLADNSVWGRIKGVGNSGCCVILEGHLDTVFARGSVHGITVDDQGRLHAPGICDDTRALAANLAVLKALKEAKIQPWHDIVIAGTSREEGLGGMAGMREILNDVSRQYKILGTLSIDGPSAGQYHANATGMVDWDVTYEGPGGHAWVRCEMPSALHAACRAVAAAAAIELPKEPKTTMTVSLIEGGQAVHGIAQRTNFKVNARSNSQAELDLLSERLCEAFRRGAEEENEAMGASGENAIRCTIEKILDIPAGNQSPDSPIVQLTVEATKALGIEPIFMPGGCTNANMSIAAGIPGINLGRGGKEYGTHTLEEWFDPKGVEACEQKSILMLLAIAGLPGVSEPFEL